GRRAVAEHLQRQDIDAVVFSREVPGCYGARFLLGRKPLVSILIPNRDQPDMLARCMRALARSTYQPLEILIIENGSKEPQTHELYATWQAQGRCRVLNWDKPFHFAAMNNFAAAEARGEFLLLLNNDVEALNADWLEFMVGYARQPAIGAVGAKLLFPDGRLQHGGLVLGLNGSAGHIGHGHFPDDPNLNLRMTFARNCAAVTGACLLVRKAVFEEVGGLHEQFPFDFNDTDFCLKLLDRGYRNVWTPDACLLHHESKSRGNSMSPKKRARYRRDTGAFLAKWQQRIRAGDPYFSPHYRLDQPIYVLRVDKRAKDETANFANIEQAKEPERS
ncbi:MAG TPA: glycosyltransferase, partial [Gemmataceae bacterium]|nr:glycosyltransferase [Gemmataceae bacterium]